MLRRSQHLQQVKKHLSIANNQPNLIPKPMPLNPQNDPFRNTRPYLDGYKKLVAYWVLIPVFLVVPLLMYVFLSTKADSASAVLPWQTEALGDEPCDRVKILKRCNNLILEDKSRSCMKLGEQFFQQCGEYDQLHRYINSAARRISEWSQAIASADKLIVLYPHNADFRWMRGKTYEEQGDITMALPDYEQAHALMPEGIQPPFHLANIYERLNRPCDGIAPLEQFVFYHPDNASAAQRQLVQLYRNPLCSGLQGTGSAKIRVRKGGDLIRSTALINNKLSGHFAVDTGATSVVLSYDFANRLNIPYKNWRVLLTRTANGIGKGYVGHLDQISIQGISAKHIEVVVSENMGDLDGLLGLSFLNRFDIHMNASEGFIQLKQKSLNHSD
ncbi:MAG: retroviral-like aspartic protease family protein [Methylococcales bacterium]